ncbi:MAG: efflux RND transporter periplasmic adaptor subunit [Hyphomicrobiaceae bacterium]|nr:efflux RND transporter periplasmic adaptor subunit [Hyphomicrobiaceae bacterium]
MVALFAGGREVATVLAKRGSAAEVVYATGVVEPVYWAKVTALQRKRIVEICKCEGQAVKQGDVLARLDDIEERAHKNELEARLQRLKDDAERLTTLVQRNIASRTSLEEKLTQVREQQARVAAQQDRIADLALKAPIDGVVLRRDGEVGEIAGTAAGDTLLWVGQPKPLQVVAEVNEDDILRVAKGQTALLRHEGYSAGPMRATVSRLTPKGDPQSKTFRVYLALPDETPLKIGMSVEANIVVGEVDDGVIVPAEAVVDHKVLKVRDGRVIIVPVEVGIRGAGAVEIRSGIAAGDELISPYDKGIASGTRVDAVRRQAASP